MILNDFNEMLGDVMRKPLSGHRKNSKFRKNLIITPFKWQNDPQ